MKMGMVLLENKSWNVFVKKITENWDTQNTTSYVGNTIVAVCVKW